MTVIDLFTNVIRQIWDGMSNITVPLLGIPVTSFLVGLFVACVAIQILNPLLGIGASIVDGFVSGMHRSRARSYPSRHSD